jgi:nicotinamidase-related amidase
MNSPASPRALIVIDIQESFRQQPRWAAISNPDVAARAAELVAAARDRGELVVWVLHTEPGTGGPFDPALGHVQLMTGLHPRDGEPVLTKTSHNAFTTTGLAQLLTSQGIGELVICGIRTEQCCETTARLAADLGYRVTFVTEATATSPSSTATRRPAAPWPRSSPTPGPCPRPTCWPAPSTPWPAGSPPSPPWPS